MELNENRSEAVRGPKKRLQILRPRRLATLREVRCPRSAHWCGAGPRWARSAIGRLRSQANSTASERENPGSSGVSSEWPSSRDRSATCGKLPSFWRR